MPVTLEQLNQSSEADFVAVCGPVFEHSPWIAKRACHAGPFKSVAQLHQTMCEVVIQATSEQQLQLIRAHPDLVGRLAREGQLTAQSTVEQFAAGLSALSMQEAQAFEKYNFAYRQRFEFPFVICARENRKDAILAAFPLRLQNDRQSEIATALTEIYKIARLRLLDAVSESQDQCLSS